MGEPKATEMPAAAAADKTSRLRATKTDAVSINNDLTSQVGSRVRLPSFSLIFLKGLVNRLATQHATCTKGPSFPSHIPEPTARHCNSRVSMRRSAASSS